MCKPSVLMFRLHHQGESFSGKLWVELRVSGFDGDVAFVRDVDFVAVFCWGAFIRCGGKGVIVLNRLLSSFLTFAGGISQADSNCFKDINLWLDRCKDNSRKTVE